MSYFFWAILSGTFFALFVISGLFIFGTTIKHRLYGLLYANFYFLRDYHLEYGAPAMGVAVFLGAYTLLGTLIYSRVALFLFLFFLYVLLKKFNLYFHQRLINKVPFLSG